jgi:hypothetical protein
MRKLKFVFILSIAFCLAVPVGTIFHELGHYIVAQFYYDIVTLHKASVTYFEYRLLEDEELANFNIILGGPISTILISILGIYLISNKPFTRISITNYPLASILKIVFAFFISREVFISLQLVFNEGVSNADEYKIPDYLNLNVQHFNIVVFIIAVSICFSILHRTVEKDSKALFLLSAAIGCGVGYWAWVLS